MKNKFKVFCDFDGTIMRKDIGDEIFKVFGKFEPLHTSLKNNEIDIKTYWYSIFETLSPDLDNRMIEEFALSFEEDVYFTLFVEFCRENQIDVSIVSDGFDLYINPIINKLNLQDLKVYCNRMIKKNNKYIPEFTRASESCNCMSASCKRNVVLNNSQDDDIIIYIGDGYSDFCGAEHSDIIFAKKNLAKYCNQNKIPHYPFTSFFDVKKTLRDVILSKSKFKKRNQAIVNIAKAYEIE